MYMSNSTKQALQELISLAYITNAKIDRMKSVLNAKFAYNQLGEKVHQFIAHYFSNGIGDALSEICLERYNIPVVFGGIPLMNQEYNSVMDVLVELQKNCQEFQIAICQCQRIADENNDKHISAELTEFIRDYNQIVDQTILFVDKIQMYKDNPMFDADVDKFFILDNLELLK